MEWLRIRGTPRPHYDSSRSLVKRDELQPIGGVLSLIRDLTGEPMRATTVPELFKAAFAALGECVPFAVAAAVMIEQNLDLHVVMRGSAALSEIGRASGREREESS